MHAADTSTTRVFLLGAVVALFAGCAGPVGLDDCLGCAIDDTCFSAGVVNPDNPCEVCTPSASMDSWSDRDGALCDDGQFCNGADTCASGACTVHAGSPCGPGLDCDEEANQCTAGCLGCDVDGACYAHLQGNPDNVCERCDTRVASDAWTPMDGGSCEDGLFCNGADTCADGVCAHEGDPCVVGVCWEDGGGQCCDMLVEAQCNALSQIAVMDTCGHTLSVVRDCDVCEDGACVCDPVAQTGCASGTEKCTDVEEVTTCAPVGAVPLGGACTVPTSGADDCVAGTVCRDGTCEEICSYIVDTCPEGLACDSRFGLFEDQVGVGTCAPSCDPVQQDCPLVGDGCYLTAITGVTSCASVPPGAEGLVQGDECYDVAGNTCYLNGCDIGYGANLPDNTCAFFCSPVDNWLGNTPGLAGDPSGITCADTFGGVRPDGPGAAFQCRYIQSYYSNTDATSPHIGMCVNPAEEGDCATFDWVQLQLDIISGDAAASGYCTEHPERCLISCISNATFDAVP